jgi:malonate transporter and related proteins
MENIIFTARVVAPVFIIIFLGLILKQRGLIDERFNAVTSKVVFNVAMPALLLQKLSSIPITEIFNFKQVIFVIAAICITFSLAWLFSFFFTKDGRDQGAFIQGAFRGNFAILGFALIRNAFGAGALGNAAIVLAVIMPIYNVLSIICLTAPLQQASSASVWKTLVSILTNPLIIAAAIALPFSIFQIPLHPIITTTTDYLAGMTLPLALIGIGSSLSLKSMHGDRKLTIWASIYKLLVLPLLCTATAIWFGFRGQELGILFFLFASPAAIASYIMAEALGSNGRLAANIVLVSTLLSLFTISVGIFILRTLHYF